MSVNDAVNERIRAIHGQSQRGDLSYLAPRSGDPMPPLPSEQRRSTPGGLTITQKMAELRAKDSLANSNRQSHGFAMKMTESPEYEIVYRNMMRGERSSFENTVLGAGKFESRDASAVTGSAGAYAIPAGFYRQLTVALKQGSPIRSLANVVKLSTGRQLSWPVVDDTSNAAAILGENVTVSHSQDPVFSRVQLQPLPWVAEAVLVPNTLVNDAGIPILDDIAALAGDKIARGTDNAYAVGTGTGQPLGLFSAGAVATGVTSASPTALVYADVESLFFSVRPAYRATGSWIMHSNTIKNILAIEDSSGRPVFTELRDRGTLFGRPAVADDNAPQLGANNVAVVFGDISRAYRIVDVDPVTSLVLTELYAPSLETGVIVCLRTDASVDDAAAARVLVCHS